MPNAILFPDRVANVPALQMEVDGWSDESHRIGVATNHEPLEDGTPISDHAVAKQEEVTLTGWVAKISSADASRPAAAWSTIRRLAKAVVPLRVLTSWGDYPEMLIDDANADSVGGSMRFTLRLKEVIRVGIQSSDVSPATASGPASQRTSEVPRSRIRSTSVR